MNEIPAESIYDSAITTLKRALKAFGQDGKFWIKGNYGTNKKRYSIDQRTFGRIDLRNIGKLRSLGEVNELEHPLYMCSMGAIMYADGPGEDRAQSLLSESIRELFPKSKECQEKSGQDLIIAFNDKKNRRFSDIQKIFKYAIKRAQKEKRVQQKLQQMIEKKEETIKQP